MKKFFTPDAPTLAALHVTTLAEGKSHYKVADAALDVVIQSLCKRCKTCQQVVAGQMVTLPNQRYATLVDDTGVRKVEIPAELRGKKFQLKDKFADRNSIGVGLSARRYELEEVASP